MRNSVAAIVALLITLGPKTAGGSGLSVKAGFGYDFFSQQFFLDSADLAGPDSLLSRWALTTDYLDDVKALLDLSYVPYDNRRLELRSTVEQTPHLLRLRVSNQWHPRAGKARFDLRSELDWRAHYRGLEGRGQSYFLGSYQARSHLPLHGATDATAQLSGEFASFYEDSAAAFDYWRLGGKAGLEHTFGQFSQVSLQGFLLGRQVPDSSSYNYIDYGVESSLFGIFGRTDLDLMLRAERKDYNRSDGEDDYYRIETDGRSRIGLGGRFFTRQEFQTDFTWFDPNDLLNDDYQQVRVAALVGIEWEQVSLALGPEFELLREEQANLIVGEDYDSWGCRFDLSLVMPGSAFLSIEPSVGRRNLNSETDQQSDFTFLRGNLIADLTLWRRFNLSAMVSNEWEWHRRHSDNTRLLLVSSLLSYSL